ncbi:MAG: HNH endonuclease [Planctomycetes bacterium]|nr:HNH endonuclease [Planctomycetota bacterium]
MTSSEAYRQLVVARAGGACEYCRLIEAATGVTFHVEHVRPQSLGGQTNLSNLSLSCPGCNLAKGDRTTGLDAHANVQPLFRPRDFEPSRLGWHLHFILDLASGIIVPRTTIAEATVATLKINSQNRVYARKLQIQFGLMG